MSDWDDDNPAGRLHRILSGFGGHRPEKRIGEALREILGVDIPDYLYSRYVADISRLIDKTIAEVDRFTELDRDLYLRWLTPARESVIHLGLFSHSVTLIQDRFDDLALIQLEYCAEFLHRQAPGVVLDTAAIDGLIELVRNAIDGILADGNLPGRVRRLLVARLREVESALQDIRITGYERVQEAMEAFTGAVVMAPESRNSDETKSWWARLWGALGLASSGTKELSEATESVLKTWAAITGGGS